MKIVSWNVNGLRSVYKKGFLDYLKNENPDLICLQEIKAREEQVIDLGIHQLKGYQAFWHPAEKPGYSGVLTYSRLEPYSLRAGLGHADIDREGRVLQLDFKDFTLLNCYFPNSQREHTRLPYKLSFNEKIHQQVNDLRQKGRHVVLCGDFNVAHKEIDLKNPKTNRDNAGFLLQEREWMDHFLNDEMTDVFRFFEPGPDHYTWWSYRPGVREKNVGWRLDYFISNSEMRDRLKSMVHRPEVLGSDHCPIVLNLKK